jgi:hypothetical protein
MDVEHRWNKQQKQMPLRHSVAWDAHGQPVHARTAARGGDYAALCCGQRVHVRRGPLRRAHFAHDKAVDACACGESAEHRAAKRVVATHWSSIRVTSVRGTTARLRLDGTPVEEWTCSRSRIRVDVGGVRAGAGAGGDAEAKLVVAVEIWHTHSEAGREAKLPPGVSLLEFVARAVLAAHAQWVAGGQRGPLVLEDVRARRETGMMAWCDDCGARGTDMHQVRTESLAGRSLVRRHVCGACARACPRCGDPVSRAQLLRMRSRFYDESCWPCAVAADHRRAIRVRASSRLAPVKRPAPAPVLVLSRTGNLPL